MGNSKYCDDYETCEKTYATLRIYPNHDPDEVTVRLGIQPTRIQRKGELCHPGKSSRVAPLNGWFLSSEGTVVSRDSRRHLDWILNQLEPRLDAVHALQDHETKMDVSCYWLSASGHGGPSLLPDQMMRLALLRLELWYDVYFVGESEDH